MNTIEAVEHHERHASPTVIELRNALALITPNHHDICLMAGLLESWIDRATSATWDYSESLGISSDLWASLQEVYAASDEERAEAVKSVMQQQRWAA